MGLQGFRVDFGFRGLWFQGQIWRFPCVVPKYACGDILVLHFKIRMR